LGNRLKNADGIALSVGIPHDSEVRARAGLIYTLQTEADEGHCFTIECDLLLHAQELLGITVEILGDALAKEFEKGTLIKEDSRIYLRDLFRAETRVAAILRRLLDAPQPFAPIDATRAIPWSESKMGLNLAPLQREALRNAVTSKVSIITGGPGAAKPRSSAP
jgi:exodeoxyribonuclease V alpha subunit